jgi:hypothetical protein
MNLVSFDIGLKSSIVVRSLGLGTTGMYTIIVEIVFHMVLSPAMEFF